MLLIEAQTHGMSFLFGAKKIYPVLE